MLRRGHPRGGAARGHEAETDQRDTEREVEPVVGGVRRDPIGSPHEPEDPQRQVDDAAADQVLLRALDRARQREADDAEQDVHEVVKDAHLEDPEQLRVRVATGEAHAAVVRRDPGDEAEDPDQDEDESQEHRDLLRLRAICHDSST